MVSIVYDCPGPDELARFIDQETDSALRTRVLEHVDRCGPCRELLAVAVKKSPPSPPIAPGATTNCTFPVGTIVDERYRILRFIARGGMGEVYAAWDTQLDESIALKTISCTGLDNARMYGRLRREVQLARKVTHTNVCRILEFGLHHQVSRDLGAPIPYLTMELLEGETLAAYTVKPSGLGRTQFLGIAQQLVAGLDAVHKCGIIHRDLKPQNVIVMASRDRTVPRVVVTDFGLATLRDLKTTSESSLDGMAVGTPAYMAPEQLQGEPPSPLWDIYALGLVLYEVAAGIQPFRGGSLAALASVKAQATIAPLCSTVAGFDARLSDIVAKCLASRPSRRYQSVDEIRRSLQCASRKVVNSPRKSRWKSLTIAAGVVTVASIGWGLQPYLRKPARAAAPGGHDLSAALPARSRSLAAPESSCPTIAETTTLLEPASPALKMLPSPPEGQLYRVEPTLSTEPTKASVRRKSRQLAGERLQAPRNVRTSAATDTAVRSEQLVASSHLGKLATSDRRDPEVPSNAVTADDGLITPSFVRKRQRNRAISDDE